MKSNEEILESAFEKEGFTIRFALGLKEDSGLIADMAYKRILFAMKNAQEEALKEIKILNQQLSDMKVAGQKIEGVLINIRHETDCLPDFYYDWIDQVLNEADDIFDDTDEEIKEQTS